MLDALCELSWVLGQLDGAGRHAAPDSAYETVDRLQERLAGGESSHGQ